MATIKRIVGQVTLTKVVDVASTTYFYLLMPSVASPPQKPTTLIPPTYTEPDYDGWTTTEPAFGSYIQTQDTTIIPGKTYYTRSGTAGNYTYTAVANPVEQDLSTYYEKIYGTTKSLYTTVRTVYTDGTFDYSDVALSSSYEAAKMAYNQGKSALELAGDTNQYFWNLTEQYSANVPAGTYVTKIAQSQFKPNPANGGGNVLIQNTGITLRQGITTGASLTSTELSFYNPVSGDRMIKLGASNSVPELVFYKTINNTVTEVAKLNANGLILANGGIVARTAGQNGYVYLSSEDNTNSITINGHTPAQNDPKWRQVIGTKFGVDSEGNLYANNANLKGADVTGAITATSLTIGSGQNAYNGVDAINISGYSITIEIDTAHTGLTTKQVYLKPHLLHNGEDITSTVTDKTQFIWYANGSSIGTQGASADGGVVAAYDDVWKVTYEFAEGAVGGASVVQTIEVDPSKYITRINQYGITVHPETISAGANYVQIDGNGFYIKTPSSANIDVSNDKILANFTANGINFYDGLGNTDTNKLASFTSNGVRIGRLEETNALIGSRYLRLDDKEHHTYFYVKDLREDNDLASWTDTFVGSGLMESQYWTLTMNVYSDLSVKIDGVTQTLNTDYTYNSNSNQIQLNTTPSAGAIIQASYITDSYLVKSYTLGIRDNDASKQEGAMSVAEGYLTAASGFSTHAEGYYTTAMGVYAHAEGCSTEAYGYSAHAEGIMTEASGYGAHVEGQENVASGESSHAEGGVLTVENHNRNVASGDASHAEGSSTQATGICSHAGGYFTIAAGNNQTVIGKGNIIDNSNQYAFIVGNGSVPILGTPNRSNALTVDWDGGLSHGIQNITSDITLTKSTGTVSADSISWTAYKAGQTIFLTVSYVSSASFSNGANRDFIFTGKYAPIVGSNGFGYYQGNGVGGRIFESNGNILLRLRNTGSTFTPNGISVTFTYITADMN